MKRGKLFISAILAGTILFSSCPAVLAKEPVTPELTLQQAVDKALDLSSSIKSAEVQKEKAKEQRGDAQDAVNYTPTGMVNPLIQVAYSTLLQTELNYQIKSKDVEALKDDIRYTVVEKYCGVLSAQGDSAAAQQTLKNAEWKYNAALAQLSVGMLAPASKVAVDAGLEAAKAGVSTAEQSLSKAYVELNSLVGYWPEDRPQLVTAIPFESLQVDNIDTEVTRAISENTNVWKALQAITIERQDLRMTTQDYDIAQLEIEVAELTAVQAKDELEKQFLLLYHDILTLEQGIGASEQGIAAAQQAVTTAKLRFEVGMATKGDIVSAEADLEAAKNTLAGLKNSHATAVSAFRNLTGRDPLPVAAQGDTAVSNTAI